MQDNNLKNLLKEYEKKRLNSEKNLYFKKNSLFSENPKLQEIEDTLNKLYLEKSKNILLNKSISTLDEKINTLLNAKSTLLKSLKIDESFLVPEYECTFCKDTGYIFNDKGMSLMCNCLKQKLIDINFNNSNIGNLNKENFDNFNINIFSDEINFEKYNSKISPRENITNIKNIALNFIKNFDNEDEKNLLFTGNTGLGKTYLSNCIAKEILNAKKTVLYQTSSNMMDNIISYKFGNNTLKSFYENLLNVDLLIIDDLGTESINNIKLCELFNVLNSRILNNNKITKTLISSNLSIQSIFNTYDERIISRLIGYYDICRFFGDDLRFKNKFNKKY